MKSFWNMSGQEASRKSKRHRLKRRRHRRRGYKDGGRGWSAASSQETPRVACSREKLEEVKKGSRLELLEATWSCHGFTLLASRAKRE